MPLKDSKLLVITDRYPHIKDSITSSFVKSQVDCLKNYIGKVYIISLTPLVPKFLSKFPFMHPRWRRDAYASDYKYDNVDVYFAKYFTLPLDFFRRKKGDVAFKKVMKIIQRENIDFALIHAHFTYPSGYVAARLRDIYRKPVVLTVHEDRGKFLEELASGDEKLIYSWRKADKIIRVNKRDLKQFKKIGINKSKLLSIPNGFSSDLFKPMDVDIARKKLGLPNDRKILVNIANLEKYKGQKYLIEAMKKVLTIRDDVLLYIVGVGPLKNYIQSLIDNYKLQDNIILAGGNKPTEEIPLWMNACDVFVLPSLSEGNPTVMFEALACGKPFVGTTVGGIPEVIINEKLGILVEPKDIDGLAKAIVRALETDWDRKYISNYAKQFTWDKIAEKIMEVYREVLGEG